MRATTKNIQILAEQVDSSLFPGTKFNIVVRFSYENVCTIAERPLGTNSR